MSTTEMCLTGATIALAAYQIGNVRGYVEAMRDARRMFQERLTAPRIPNQSDR